MAEDREFKIGVLAGDGIGPEITDATIEVLHAASERTGLKLRLMHRLVGWKAREQEGTLLSEATEQTLRASDGWIMGPTFAGEYPKDDHTNGHPSGYLRREFEAAFLQRRVDEPSVPPRFQSVTACQNGAFISSAGPRNATLLSERAMLMGGACAKAYGWSPNKG
jgi:hypothetical protein